MSSEGLFSRKTVLCSFDCIVNTDLGILRTVKELYGDSKYFDFWVMDNSDSRIKYYILHNKTDNVLNLILKPEYKSSADSLLEELKSTHYDKILDNSEYTNVVSMLFSTAKLDNINTTIWCKNKLEEQYIRTKTHSLGLNMSTMLSANISVDDIDKYNTLFINRVLDIKDILKDIGYRFVYLYNAVYNLEESDEGFKVPKYLNNIVDRELITLISPYIVDKEFFIDG